MDAMVGEYFSIMKSNVWEVVPQTNRKFVVGFRWVYKIKHIVDCHVDEFKARFVVKGFS